MQKISHPSPSNAVVDDITYDRLFPLSPDGHRVPINPHFRQIPRVSALESTREQILESVNDCMGKGIPLVVEGFIETYKRRNHKGRARATNVFTFDWMKQNASDLEITPRCMESWEDLKNYNMRLFIDELLEAEERNTKFNIYGKDIICPKPWEDSLKEILPPQLVFNGPTDLFVNFEKKHRPLNLMVYIGSDNTRTPGHVDICGSYGHNLMVHGSKEARSVWIIVPTEYKAQATKLWSNETTSVDLDNQVLTYQELVNAEFPVYIFEQKIDEFIIIPSDAIHQVSNYGGPSVKVAWNRTTAQTLKYWFDQASEHYSFIRKPEIYKNKSLVYLSLQTYVSRLQSVDASQSQPRSFLDDYVILVDLFKSILLDEHIDLSKLEYPIVETNHDPRDCLSRTCDFCHQDIFNRFFHCSHPECLSKANSNLKLGRAFDEKGGYDLCMRCYAIGRGCKHSDEMELCKFWEFDDLLQYLRLAVRTFNTSESRKEEGLSALVLPSGSVEDFGRDRSDSSAATLACILKIDRLRTQKLLSLPTCHQCRGNRRKSYTAMLLCTSCKKQYCTSCVYLRYGQVIYTLWSNPWKCYCCAKICNCSICRYPIDSEQIIQRVEALHPPYFFTQTSIDLRNIDNICGRYPPEKVRKRLELSKRILEQPERRELKFENCASLNELEVSNGDPGNSCDRKNSLPCDQEDEAEDSRADIVRKMGLRTRKRGMQSGYSTPSLLPPKRVRSSKPRTDIPQHEPTYRRRGRKPKARIQNLEDGSAERDIGVRHYSETSVTDSAGENRNEEASTDLPDAEIPLASTSASRQSSTLLSVDDIETLKKYDLPEVINLLDAFPPDLIATYERIRSKSVVAAQYMLDTRLKKHLLMSEGSRPTSSCSGINDSSLAAAGQRDIDPRDSQEANAPIDAPPCSVTSADEGMIGSSAVDNGPANVTRTAETDRENDNINPVKGNDSPFDVLPQIHRTKFGESEDNRHSSSNSSSTNSRGQAALCIVVPRVRRRSTQSANSLVHSIDNTQNASSLPGVSSTLVSSPVSSCSSLSSASSSIATSPSSTPSLSVADDQSRSASPTPVDISTRDNSLDDDAIAQSLEGYESDPDLRIPEEYRYVLPVAQRRQKRKSAMAKKNYCVGRESTRSSSCRI